MRLLTRFLLLFPCLLPAVAGAQGFYEREAAEERRSWFLVDPEEVVGVAFPEEVLGEEEFRVEINVPARRLSLLRGEEIIKTYPVAVGSLRYRTPVGPRRIQSITWNPWWFPPPYSDWARGAKPTPPGPHNPLGHVKMPLGGDIVLHGTNVESSVGRPVSHGCMRMRNRDAEELAWFFQSRFSSETDVELLSTYRRHRGQTFNVRLHREIPVTILYDRVAVQEDALEIYPDIYGRERDLWEQILTELSGIGIPPWEVDPSKLEELEETHEGVTVPILALLAFPAF